MTSFAFEREYMGQLENKVALITGGSKGIGLATALLFAKEGAKVAIVARGAEDLKKAKALIPTEALCIQGDVSNLNDLDRIFHEVNQKYGKINVLFVNAGVAERIGIDKVSEEAFDRISNINYKGAFFTVQKSISHLDEGASIILNASIAALVGLDWHSIYSSNKAAVIQLSKTIAADLVSRNIRVNAISPGYIKTPIWDQWLEDNPAKYKELCNDVPLGHRFGKPEEIASVALFLASDAASYITAQNIVVDGGLTSIIREYTKPR
jgi:NAD(P)-dependent dehydrogenase (short-subunit alcohol dehydrogenase family)